MLKRLLKYAYRFGSLRGPYILSRVLSGKANVQLSLPGYVAPVWLRTGTSDVPTFEKVFISLDYEFPYPDRQPGLIIDAGANVGYASLYFAKKFPKSRVVAVEPEGANYEVLVRNVGPYCNVTPVCAALWSRSATLRIMNPNDDFWAFRVTEARPGDANVVRGVTVPELMAMAGVDTVGILKLDIEGAEKELFESNVEPWLDKVRVIVIELHDWLREGCSTAFYRATTRLSFNQFPSGENVVLVRYAERSPPRG